MKADLIAMWNAVTGASHPVFGTAMPGAKGAFEAGLAMGQKLP